MYFYLVLLLIKFNVVILRREIGTVPFGSAGLSPADCASVVNLFGQASFYLLEPSVNTQICVAVQCG